MVPLTVQTLWVVLLHVMVLFCCVFAGSVAVATPLMLAGMAGEAGNDCAGNGRTVTVKSSLYPRRLLVPRLLARSVQSPALMVVIASVLTVHLLVLSEIQVNEIVSAVLAGTLKPSPSVIGVVL